MSIAGGQGKEDGQLLINAPQTMTPSEDEDAEENKDE